LYSKEYSYLQGLGPSVRGNEGQPDFLLQGPEVLQIRPRGNIQVIPLPFFIITVAKSRQGFSVGSAKKAAKAHSQKLGNFLVSFTSVLVL
jgi:hypothetical protein